MPLHRPRAAAGASNTDYRLLAAGALALLVAIVVALAQHAYRVHGDPCRPPAAQAAPVTCE